MIYYWILKYLLAELYSKRGFLLAYHEGGAFGILIASNVIFLMTITGTWNHGIAIFISLIVIAVDFIITWDDEKVEQKFMQISRDRKELEPKFYAVKVYVIFTFVSTICDLLYISFFK